MPCICSPSSKRGATPNSSYAHVKNRSTIARTSSRFIAPNCLACGESRNAAVSSLISRVGMAVEDTMRAMEIVLVEPEIPHNTGCAARLAAALGLRLHLVEPLGFSLESKYLKRAG